MTIAIINHEKHKSFSTLTNLLLLKPVRRRPTVLVPDRLVPVADEDDGHDDHDDEESPDDDARDETDAAGVSAAAG